MPTSARFDNRFERRRAETRKALVRAARQILAETGDTSASIQAIAERADVGFGSFYNHFESKADLFEAAVVDALEEFGQAFDEHLTGIDDPAELVAAGFRLSARMADSHTELVRVLRHRGLGRLHSDNGLSRRALRDLHVGIASGRFTAVEPAVALAAVGGTLLSLLELRFARPDLDADESASDLAEMVLLMLGVPPDDAREVARRPLPELG
ncbi:TetR/AcrR family transcriptional regulator [Streptomyces acidiscabies]|uniref:TetR/AcrR family transcriptional regulator n=1 Tax=Streptomyces acidiscabies TaxID=42234 RepID=A0AAP6EKW4_9ACTN|nr:TetR/AcrR family transcriptional regulator [Streptomyces acidiscabies]MBP5942158.1 TetR/AcrR family transcriptional regulator [Streptomyces sp. LBUM 1476]MBZ3913671.1 TetR/AcrR family transcriptional regulator [Streptomyces acidiscabies]MDX2966484.1 TetR/AcrR family transcriptional regulator [Streptomyces acidiscabies]MDX3026037.1 TetR/AcrR family transcriptional regulator [Streptomyces acidiscabies]MDX3796437.1 TetR/AcrR family transcriptional regulator [Streptomyces acidiscabies]